MPLRHAQALFPEAQLLPATPSRYHKGLEAVLALLDDFSERMEVHADLRHQLVVYLDLGSANERSCSAIREEIATGLKLDAQVGLAGGKFTAYAAAKTCQTQRFIPKGQEKRFLEPLPLHLLGLKPDQQHEFDLLGLRTLGDFAALPRNQSARVTGKRANSFSA